MNKFNFLDLTPETREHMLAEIELDENGKGVYQHGKFNANGKKEYPKLLQKAVAEGNERTLIGLLDPKTHFEDIKDYEIQRLCCNEFNKYYIRGVCSRALSIGKEYVEIYRAKKSKNERPGSKENLDKDKYRPAREIREELRNSISSKTFPINTGLSVKLTEQ